MPSISTSGGGGYMPAASDAYAALLGRMPAYFDAAMERRKTKDDQAALDAQQAHYGREKQLERDKILDQERVAGIAKTAADEKQARADAQKEKDLAAARERSDAYALNQQAQDRTQTSFIGNDPRKAAHTAQANFVKMRLGVPGAY